MKAVGYHHSLPIDNEMSLVDLDVPEPIVGPKDLLVEVKAVSVNPIDTKVRTRTAPAEGQAKVLGWDAAGIVLAVGAEVAGFRPGDKVWYAGALQRPGADCERHVVDHRLASLMPRKLAFDEAAAMPLTSVTAWELLFERLGVPQGGGEGRRLLVVGGAGGVGSMLVQLARRLTRLEVIATASRPESVQWAQAMGAHHVIDHARGLREELHRIGCEQIHSAALLTHSEAHFPAAVEALVPYGRIGLIDDPASPLDVTALKRKSLSLHWEMMFTASLFELPEMAAQGRVLAEVARLVDEGILRTTKARHFGTLDAARLRRAHAWVESGRAIGKGVLSLG